MTRPSLLILCFDAIHVDPRVMKQVRLFANDYDVTTCSPGPSPDPRVTHLELDASGVRPRGRFGDVIDDIARAREWFGWIYRHDPLVVAARSVLRGRQFDAAIANDAATVGVAIEVVGAERVHADLHEYFPGMAQPEGALGDRQRRYLTWLITQHAARAGSSTTVGQEIATRYGEFGLRPGVVWNATHLRTLSPSKTDGPIRIVHSGNPFRDRGLQATMQAVAASRNDITLDLYLTKQNLADLEAIKDLATELGSRITVHEPVPQTELIETLNGYDVGIFVLPYTSQNSELALPNKFFDFVQARLGIVIGPSIEMERLVRAHELGAVTDDFSVDAIRSVLDELTIEQVERWKAAADRAAPTLTSDAQLSTWADAVAARTA